MKRYKVSLVCVFLFSMMQVMCQLILPEMTDKILRYGVQKGNMGFIYRTGLQMVAMTIGVGICMIIGGYFSARVTADFTRDVSADLFRKVKGFSSEEYNHFGCATLLTRSTADISIMQIVMINALRSALLIPFTGLGALIVAIRMNWMLTIVVMISFLVTLSFITVCNRRSQPLFVRLQKCTDGINLLVKEKLTGTRNIRGFGREEYEDKRLEYANQEAFDQAIRANRSINFLSPVMQGSMNIAMVAIYFLGAVQIQNQMMDAASLIKFLQYILNFVASLASVAGILKVAPKAKISADRVLEVLDYSGKPGRHIEEPVKEDEEGIEVQNVSFGYQGAEKKVIRDVSFTAKQGETVAILGATGAGKTTLLSLLLRIYDVQEGNVYIDGENIQSMSLQEVRTKFSYAPQKAMILQDTIYNNLKVANENLSREEAVEVLKLAEAWSFVEMMPEGIDTMMAQNGMNVSGGQRQRLSLARCLARDAKIYLFDDSFSALDMKTDAKVRANIREYLKEKITIIVAQRISTIRHADHILLMDNGKVVASGRHEELLKNSRLYREIYATQCYTEEGGN